MLCVLSVSFSMTSWLTRVGCADPGEADVAVVVETVEVVVDAGVVDFLVVIRRREDTVEGATVVVVLSNGGFTSEESVITFKSSGSRVAEITPLAFRLAKSVAFLVVGEEVDFSPVEETRMITGISVDLKVTKGTYFASFVVVYADNQVPIRR